MDKTQIVEVVEGAGKSVNGEKITRKELNQENSRLVFDLMFKQGIESGSAVFLDALRKPEAVIQEAGKIALKKFLQ